MKANEKRARAAEIARALRAGALEAPAVVATPADFEVRRVAEVLLLRGERLPFPARQEAGTVSTGEGWYPTPIYEEEATPGAFQGEVIPLDVLAGALLLLDLEVREERAPGILGGFQYEGTRKLPLALQDPEVLEVLEALGVGEGLLYYPEEAFPSLKALEARFSGPEGRASLEAFLIGEGLAQTQEEAEGQALRFLKALSTALRSLTEGPVVGWGFVTSTGQTVAWWGQGE